MDQWVPVLLSSLATFGASSGFWAYMSKRSTTNTAVTRLLMGLAYDKIIHNGMMYIERGEITKDEFEDFRKYLYEPYKDLGGNGVAERVMEEVSHLRLTSSVRYYPINQVQRLNTETNDDHSSAK